MGDVLGITDSNGTLVAEYRYDAYGKPVKILDGNGNDVSTNYAHIANINPIRYRGYYYDIETGFYYVSSRYYDPEIGRWINADALASNFPSIIGYNLYAYCGNNPINNIDPMGTCYYNANGQWCHDNWEYLYDYEKKSEPIDLTEKLTSYMEKNADNLKTYMKKTA